MYLPPPPSPLPMSQFSQVCEIIFYYFYQGNFMVKIELPNLLVSQEMNYPTHFSSVPTRGINSERSLILSEDRTQYFRPYIFKHFREIIPIPQYDLLFMLLSVKTFKGYHSLHCMQLLPRNDVSFKIKKRATFSVIKRNNHLQHATDCIFWCNACC